MAEGLPGRHNGGGSLERLLRKALHKLNHMEQFDKYLDYLNSEWFYTADDLRIAQQDDGSWQNLKLPARLKIEMASELQNENAAGSLPKHPTDEDNDYGIEVIEEGAEPSPGLNSTKSDDQGIDIDGTIGAIDVSTTAPFDENTDSSWVKCYAEDSNAFYYYNLSTQENTWECPDTTKEYDIYEYSEELQDWVLSERDFSIMAAATGDEGGHNEQNYHDNWDSQYDKLAVAAAAEEYEPRDYYAHEYYDENGAYIGRHDDNYDDGYEYSNGESNWPTPVEEEIPSPVSAVATSHVGVLSAAALAAQNRSNLGSNRAFTKPKDVKGEETIFTRSPSEIKHKRKGSKKSHALNQEQKQGQLQADSRSGRLEKMEPQSVADNAAAATTMQSSDGNVAAMLRSDRKSTPERDYSDDSKQLQQEKWADSSPRRWAESSPRKDGVLFGVSGGGGGGGGGVSSGDDGSGQSSGRGLSRSGVGAMSTGQLLGARPGNGTVGGADGLQKGPRPVSALATAHTTTALGTVAPLTTSTHSTTAATNPSAPMIMYGVHSSLDKDYDYTGAPGHAGDPTVESGLKPVESGLKSESGNSNTYKNIFSISREGSGISVVIDGGDEAVDIQDSNGDAGNDVDDGDAGVDLDALAAGAVAQTAALASTADSKRTHSKASLAASGQRGTEGKQSRKYGGGKEEDDDDIDDDDDDDDGELSVEGESSDSDESSSSVHYIITDKGRNKLKVETYKIPKLTTAEHTGDGGAGAESSAGPGAGEYDDYFQQSGYGYDTNYYDGYDYSGEGGDLYADLGVTKKEGAECDSVFIANQQQLVNTEEYQSQYTQSYAYNYGKSVPVPEAAANVNNPADANYYYAEASGEGSGYREEGNGAYGAYDHHDNINDDASDVILPTIEPTDAYYDYGTTAKTDTAGAIADTESSMGITSSTPRLRANVDAVDKAAGTAKLSADRRFNRHSLSELVYESDMMTTTAAAAAASSPPGTWHIENDHAYNDFDAYDFSTTPSGKIPPFNPELGAAAGAAASLSFSPSYPAQVHASEEALKRGTPHNYSAHIADTGVTTASAPLEPVTTGIDIIPATAAAASAASASSAGDVDRAAVVAAVDVVPISDDDPEYGYGDGSGDGGYAGYGAYDYSSAGDSREAQYQSPQMQELLPLEVNPREQEPLRGDREHEQAHDDPYDAYDNTNVKTERGQGTGGVIQSKHHHQYQQHHHHQQQQQPHQHHHNRLYDSKSPSPVAMHKSLQHQQEHQHTQSQYIHTADDRYSQPAAAANRSVTNTARSNPYATDGEDGDYYGKGDASYPYDGRDGRDGHNEGRASTIASAQRYDDVPDAPSPLPIPGGPFGMSEAALIDMALGSPAAPGTSTPKDSPAFDMRRDVKPSKKGGKMGKIFRLNLFGKAGPVVPASPPPSGSKANSSPVQSSGRSHTSHCVEVKPHKVTMNSEQHQQHRYDACAGQDQKRSGNGGGDEITGSIHTGGGGGGGGDRLHTQLIQNQQERRTQRHEAQQQTGHHPRVFGPGGGSLLGEENTVASVPPAGRSSSEGRSGTGGEGRLSSSSHLHSPRGGWEKGHNTARSSLGEVDSHSGPPILKQSARTGAHRQGYVQGQEYEGDEGHHSQGHNKHFHDHGHDQESHHGALQQDAASVPLDHRSKVHHLVSMGFNATEAVLALSMCDDNLARATVMLLDNSQKL